MMGLSWLRDRLFGKRKAATAVESHQTAPEQAEAKAPESAPVVKGPRGMTVYHVPRALAKMRRQRQRAMHKLAECRPTY